MPIALVPGLYHIHDHEVSCLVHVDLVHASNDAPRQFVPAPSKRKCPDRVNLQVTWQQSCNGSVCAGVRKFNFCKFLSRLPAFSRLPSPPPENRSRYPPRWRCPSQPVAWSLEREALCRRRSTTRQATPVGHRCR